jgi:hypothetical protein
MDAPVGGQTEEEGIGMDIYGAIQSQYQAALEMLRQAIAACPEELWNAEGDRNRFWRVAYHALFYTHLYLQKTIEDFVPWSKHQDEYASLSAEQTEGAAAPYSKDDLLAYHALCQEQVRNLVPALDPDGGSGFHWLPFTKLELQFYNIRHLQHHTGQLYERLRTQAGVGAGWVSARHE